MNFMKNQIIALVLLTGTFSLGAANAGQKIVSAANGNCLASSERSQEPATRLVVTPCNDNPNQHWEFFPDGRIENVKSGLCMGIPWSKMNQRAGVYQVECDGKKHRLWQIEFIGDATVVVRSQAGGLCLDLEKKTKAAKTNAVQDPCTGAPSQIWMTTAAASALHVPAAAQSAFDPAAPVREILRLDSKGDTLSYFSEDRLATLYSKDLIGFYNRALNTPWAQEMGGRVFDYDFVISGQDHCPLENMTFQTEQPFETSWDVTVQFQSQACWGNEDYTKVVFLVIGENGRPVIDDIFAYHGGETDILKVTLDQFWLQQQ